MITNVFLLVIVILLSFLCFQLRRMSVTLSRTLSLLVKLHLQLSTSTIKKSISKKPKKSQTSETSSAVNSSPTSSPLISALEPSERVETSLFHSPEKFFDIVYPAHCISCKDCISSDPGSKLCNNEHCPYYSFMLNQIVNPV